MSLVRAAGVIGLCLVFVAVSSHETVGFQGKKPSLDDSLAAGAPAADALLDAIQGGSIGVQVVALSQVREEFQKAKSGDKVEPPDSDEKAVWTHDDLLSKGIEPKTFEWLHPLVPEDAPAPCAGEGVVIKSVASHSPAARVGFHRGDVIYNVNNKKVATPDEFQEELEKGRQRVATSLKFGLATFEAGKWKRKTVTASLTSRKVVLTAPLRRVADEVKGVDYYSHLDMPTEPLRAAFFRKAGETPQDFSLSIQFSGKTWIFLDELIVRADDQVFERKLKSNAVSRVAQGGSVTETVHLDVALPENAKLLNAILKAKKVVVRFSGTDGAEDVEVPTTDRAPIVELYNIYQELELAAVARKK